MKKILLLICLATFSTILFAQQGQSDTELIRAVLENYIEGRNNGDTARLSSAFHQQADIRYRNEKTGNLVIWPIADYISRFKPGAKINCTGKIISINIAGSAAQAKVELYYPNTSYVDYFALLKIANKWVIASKVYSQYPVHEKLGNNGKKTGFHFGEVAQVYKPFYEAGYDIDFACPKEGKTYNYGADLNNEADTWFMQNMEAVGKLFNALKLSEIIPKKYDLIYFAGGHGVMWDLAIDSISAMITRTIDENNGVVGTVCHGSAAMCRQTSV